MTPSRSHPNVRPAGPGRGAPLRAALAVAALLAVGAMALASGVAWAGQGRHEGVATDAEARGALGTFKRAVASREPGERVAAVRDLGRLVHATAKAKWMVMFGHPAKQRARPEVHRAMHRALDAITGRTLETPEALADHIGSAERSKGRRRASSRR